MKRLIILIIMILLLASCGARKVRKDDTVSNIKEKEQVSKLVETEISANKQINENTLYTAGNFQADSIVVTKGGTKYYNPRSKKEVISSTKESKLKANFSSLKFENFDLEKEFYKASKVKIVEKKQVNFFTMIMQFWPLLLIFGFVFYLKNKRVNLLF